MRGDAYPDQNAAYIVFTSLGDNKRSERLLRQEANTVVLAKPGFMHWSDRPITSTREDHPAVMPSPGGYALILNPPSSRGAHASSPESSSTAAAASTSSTKTR